MNKVYIGIDPGLNGAIAIINSEGIVYNTYKMPLVEKVEIDVNAIFDIVGTYSSAHVIIEDVHSIFGASAKSNFSFGFGCGALFATLKLLRIPFTEVSPKQWQKEMWQGIKPVEIITDKKNKDGSPKYKVDTKATSLLAVKRLFPNVSLLASEKCKTPHDGIVDAILLGEYGRRKNY